MSNTKKSKSKKFICSIILCFAMILSAFIGFNFAPAQVYASTLNGTNVSSDLLSNWNFSTSSSATPVTPNGWSEIKEDNNQDVNTRKNIIRGIVDVKDEKSFPTSKYYTTRPKMTLEESSDTSYFKNLMINSYKGEGRFGYKSNSFTLDANSYYKIDVRLLTHKVKNNEEYNADPVASIYLSGLTSDEEYSSKIKFENINTVDAWETYTFYVDTNKSASVSLELWLGTKTKSSKGAVFFNNVTIYRYNEDYYTNNFKVLNSTDTDYNNYNVISLSNETTNPVTNSNFESPTPIGWDTISKSESDLSKQRCEIVDIDNFKLDTGKKTITAPGSTNSPNNKYALFMYNKNDSYQGIESSKISIQSQSYYKISFRAKSDCNVGSGATVYLVDNSKNPIDKVSLTLSTTYSKNSNTYRNDWSQYNFYVYGDKFDEKEITIQIWLGTTTSKTSGYVFIDDFTIENINYETFSNNSSSSNSKELNFNADSDKFTIVNSNFDKTSNEDNLTKYPLAPTNWTQTTSSKYNIFSGVIKADEEHFNANVANYKDGSIAIVRPANHPIYKDRNNVLMMGSSSEINTQSYKSSDISLSANSYYRFSFYALTNYSQSSAQINLGARVTLKTSTKTLYDYFNINHSDNEWHEYVVYIKTGNTSETANIVLNFDQVRGYVFFDDFKLETSKEEVFNNFQTDRKEYTKIDLSYENFDNRTYNKVSTSYQEPNNWTGEEIDETTPVEFKGIVSTDSQILDNIPPTLSGNKNVLYIKCQHDVIYNYTSIDSFTFNSGTYYKITINVLTNDIWAENTSDAKDYGASISLASNEDIIIKGINTHSSWKTYTIYLNPKTSITSEITLSLGVKDEKVQGEVLFDNLKVEEISNDTYKSELKTSDKETSKYFINYEEESKSEEEKSTWKNEFNWLILPSLITAIAIILAVVCFYARKINFNRKPKIKTKYDRRKTLDKDIDRREKIALRQQIIDELNDELKSIDAEIEEFNQLAEQKLEELKNQIIQEKEDLKRQKIELEIKKKEATADREKQLKQTPELVGNVKAEKEFSRFMEKLDKQEMNLQKQINQKDIKLESTKEADKSKLAKILERKEFIKNEIAKIEAEIEEIAKEEAEMWEEYKRAKLEAKQRKAEYKAQQKLEKENKKSTPAKSKNTSAKKTKQNSSEKKRK